MHRLGSAMIWLQSGGCWNCPGNSGKWLKWRKMEYKNWWCFSFSFRAPKLALIKWIFSQQFPNIQLRCGPAEGATLSVSQPGPGLLNLMVNHFGSLEEKKTFICLAKLLKPCPHLDLDLSSIITIRKNGFVLTTIFEKITNVRGSVKKNTFFFSRTVHQNEFWVYCVAIIASKRFIWAGGGVWALFIDKV